MKKTENASKKSSVLANALIVILLAVLVFMIYEIFTSTKRREILPPAPSKQEAVFSGQEQKIVAVEPAFAPVVTPSLAPKFTIQAASFQDKAKADSAAGSLKKKGYLPTVEMADLGAKGIWYRVYVGGFATKEEAQGFLEAIKKDNPSAFIKQL